MKKFYAFLLLFSIIIVKTKAQIAGCPDPAANNYNSSATQNDGSCSYSNITLNPKFKYNVGDLLSETSGLIWWKKKIWTHNDSGGDHAIYSMNNSTNTIINTVNISNATNVDWEDITQDQNFIYIGDFGNNASGNRTNLKIYKISKSAVLSGNSVTATVINFSYSDQTDFTPKSSNNTNFDCEAMIAYGDSLYLFSKDWVDNKTRLYRLPKNPGTFSAQKIGELNVQGLITGAEVIPDKRAIVLSGYNSLLSPFIYLLYDFTSSNFFNANKRKVLLNESFTQMEGICAKSATLFYVSNEKTSKLGINTPAKIDQLNLSSLLNPYYSSLSALTTNRTVSQTATTNTIDNNKWARFITASNWLKFQQLNTSKEKTVIELYDMKGMLLLRKTVSGQYETINLSSFLSGAYIAKAYCRKDLITKKYIVY